MAIFDGKRILVIGGTGSLGKVLVGKLLAGEAGRPDRIVVMSRDEAKQHQMRVDYHNLRSPTDEVVYENFRRTLQFRIGDVRDYNSVAAALQDVDIVVNAAALKQVPACEYFPMQAVQTNILGPENIVNAIRNLRLPVETLVGVSTDKAVAPVNVMGMTKALQERLLISAQLALPDTRILIVRYGNVLASRGSVVPLFRQQIQAGGPVTITDERMTRFLLSLPEAVDTIVAAIASGRPAETWVPEIPAARITDLARAMIGDRPIETVVTGIRPGEKIHEVLVSAEESVRTERRGNYYAIHSLLPEIAAARPPQTGDYWEYTSGTSPMDFESLRALLDRRGLLAASAGSPEMELLC
ncbi:polysaccharide biosynthesis protein [Azospirillum sp. RWY-5-1]|uniref:Polysaccharide biosynthesis protein n=1 Tax=Azospirillum oleiclasticum TaxID=2735135 RepID=A0ABX2TLW8_9PROT|nr:polysaccharide biosynthesis protein [Azospirillum oleiclasticum]NYZ17766.1 polysaccharide biosynthesis protein [Azospirillum oleiclasticum]NYZ24188.1 polysaccharide biosynthesis protein [Azospirillum oleiclasticum]